MATVPTGTITGNITTPINLAAGNYADPVTNAGTISVSSGPYALGATSNWTLVNDGTILGAVASGDYGVYLNSGAITNAAGAMIAGGGALEIKSGAGVVLNSGVLAGSYLGGAFLYGGGYLANTGTGRITGAQYGAGFKTAAGTVVNHGLISGASNAGVVLAKGGDVENFAGATISGGSYGIRAGHGAGTVQSAGTIVGGNGTAVSLAYGYHNRVDVAPGAVFQGIVDGGNTIGSPVESTLQLAYYVGRPTGTLTNLNASFVNFQQISVKGDWVFGANDTLLPGVTLTDAGAGTKSPAGTIGGYGLMLNANDAVTVEPGALVSRASSTTPYTAGIFALGNAGNVYVANAGLVTNAANNTAAGIALFDGGTIVNGLTSGGVFTATGTIVGHDVGIYATAAAGIAATIVNPGTIQGIYSSGVDLKAVAAVGNFSGGTIIAPQNGLVAEVGGTVVNAGLIAATSASNSQGVYLNGGAVTNLASGTISGWVGIQAGLTAAPMTVVDAGTIAGSAYAIQFRAGANNALVLDPGAYVHGTVGGQNTLNSGFVTSLELAAGTGTFNSSITTLRDVYQIDVNSGANWVWTGSGATLAAGAVLSDFGALTLASALAGAGDISLGTNATLAVMPGATPAPTITSFGGHETIEVVGGSATGLTLSGSQLTIAGTGVTLNVNTALPARDFGFVTSNGNTYITACFAAGTRIAGAFGKVPVEALREGDRVRTASGRLATVRWLGHRRTNLRQHPRPHDVMPVRVRAGAFGDRLPSRDLVLSPDHAVFMDGYLVPIRHLVNGQSIVQETRDAVTYWHVELERHDVLLAEDLPCESYLDTGNRAAFENAEGPMELHPDFARRVWREQGCAPILVDPAEPALRALHMRLLARARFVATARVTSVSA